MVTVLAVFVMTWFCVEDEDKKENGVSSGVTAFGDKVVSDGVRSVQVDENADCDKAYVTVVDLKDGGGSRIYGKGAQAALSGVHIDRAGTYILSGRTHRRTDIRERGRGRRSRAERRKDQKF